MVPLVHSRPQCQIVLKGFKTFSISVGIESTTIKLIECSIKNECSIAASFTMKSRSDRMRKT